MPDDMMVILGAMSSGDWDVCIEKLLASGKYPGGSFLDNGALTTK